MSFKVEVSGAFKRAYKPLAKKYAGLDSDLLNLIETLESAPEYGTPIGPGIFKIRLSISAKRKGKSGGARVITLVRVMQEKVYLLTIYDKSERADLRPGELEALIAGLDL